MIYLGTYGKSALPGVRIGFAVADQRITDAAGRDVGTLADQLSKIKSMVTVNTPPVARGEIAAPAAPATMVEALRFVRGTRLILGILLVDTSAMVFGMPRAVFPALGLETFHGGPTAVGLLFAAPSAGALLAAATSGWASRIDNAGRAVLIAVTVWGAALAAVGLTRQLPLALALLTVAGAADVVSEVFRLTILQLRTPDALRGWVTALLLAQT
ncbi:hypothetical protein ACT1U9_32480 [Streptomyces sp. BR1]|uniref:hypothetical protein n=1 Tax=Streptomyces sp. BR1 TaxID=1592323 RepID=UPI00402B97C4